MINRIEKWLIDRRQRAVVNGEVSNWKSVLSGVPKGSVLKFADGTKVFRKNKSDADRQQLQNDLNKLTEWSENQQVLFNYGKCKCLHSGHENEDAQNTMDDLILNIP